MDGGKTDPAFDEGRGQERPHGGGGGGAAASADELLRPHPSFTRGLRQGHCPGDQGREHRGKDSCKLSALAGIETQGEIEDPPWVATTHLGERGESGLDGRGRAWRECPRDEVIHGTATKRRRNKRP